MRPRETPLKYENRGLRSRDHGQLVLLVGSSHPAPAQAAHSSEVAECDFDKTPWKRVFWECRRGPRAARKGLG